ncbi:hypothetical protein DJ90_3772 [Paenibacillus macerans]|uniref:Uncharacterized protein n=1 Tax=Paenibacillus macerans TaxID=44252 RepID=A0A090ZMU4_PAEMA|nr:hypothetical protein DJ90_3772 [Paenibacillus macerans]
MHSGYGLRAWTPGMDSGAWTPGMDSRHGLPAWTPGTDSGYGLWAWTPGNGTQGLDSRGRTPGHGTRGLDSRGRTPGHGTRGLDSRGRTPGHGTRGLDSRGRTSGESTPATKCKSAGDFCQNLPKTARQMQICSSFPVNRYFFIKWSQNRCIFAFHELKERNLRELQMYFCSWFNGPPSYFSPTLEISNRFTETILKAGLQSEKSNRSQTKRSFAKQKNQIYWIYPIRPPVFRTTNKFYWIYPMSAEGRLTAVPITSNYFK